MLAKIINGSVVKYPYTILDLFNDNPNVSFPNDVEGSEDILNTYNVYTVQAVAEPSANVYKNVQEGSIVLDNGTWKQSWDVTDASEAQVNARLDTIKGAIKGRRQTELFNTDWTQLADSPLTSDKKAEFAIYRQALRDITAQAGYPDNVVWPDKPVV